MILAFKEKDRKIPTTNRTPWANRGCEVRREAQHPFEAKR